MADALVGLLLIALGGVLPVLAAWAIVRRRQRREARRVAHHAPHAPTPPPAPDRH